MILQISVVFTIAFVGGYFAGGMLNKAKKKKKEKLEKEKRANPALSETERKRESLN